MAYDGGKGAMYHKIINRIPPHRVYIEPFLGGGEAEAARGDQHWPRPGPVRVAHHGLERVADAGRARTGDHGVGVCAG